LFSNDHIQHPINNLNDYQIFGMDVSSFAFKFKIIVVLV